MASQRNTMTKPENLLKYLDILKPSSFPIIKIPIYVP